MNKTIMEPNISIVIPTHNRAHLLLRAIESILTQNFQKFELIIVNDASTDDTATLVKSISDERIRLINLNKNQGASKARNIGIKAANAKYIAFLDSDDEWLPGKLEKQYALIKNSSSNVGIVYSGFNKHKGNKVRYVPDSTVKHKSGNIFNEILKHNFITFQTIVAKKECFEKSGLFDENLKCRHDWELLIRLSRDWLFLYIDEPLVNVYSTEDSITLTHELDMFGWLPIIEKYITVFKRHPSILANHYMRIATWATPVNIADFKKRKKLMIKAVKCYPFVNYKFVILFIISLFGPKFYIYFRGKFK